jgi:hypothetical protein
MVCKLATSRNHGASLRVDLTLEGPDAVCFDSCSRQVLLSVLSPFFCLACVAACFVLPLLLFIIPTYSCHVGDPQQHRHPVFVTCTFFAPLPPL